MHPPCRFQPRHAASFTLAIVVTMAPATLPAASVPVSLLLQISRVAGSPSGVAGGPVDTGPALLSLLNQPEGVSIDGGGNLYIADTANDQIERIDAATGNITTVAANGLLGSSGTTLLNQPAGVLVDPHGNLYIADTGNHLVRFVRMDTGVITTVAGNPAISPFEPSNIGDGGPATLAALDTPTALALDANGNLYVADTGDSRVREISASTGIITTVAGVVGASGGYNGDNVAATQATLNFPAGIAVHFTGQVYFSDRDNNRIRRISKAGIISTLAGNGTAGFVGDGDVASLAELRSPVGMVLDHEGNLYVADSGNNALRVISKGLNFPAVEIGSSSPPTHSIFLRINEATAVSIPIIPAAQIQPVFPSGMPAQEFSVGNILGCAADGTTLNPAGSVCAVPITFTPKYPGIRTGAMHLTANGASISVGLYGTGLAPQAIMVPGIIQTTLDSADASGAIAFTAPQRIAVDPAGNLYVADRASNVVWSWQNSTGATPSILAGGGALDRLDDALVGPAAADVAVHVLHDFLPRGVLGPRQQGLGLHDLPGLAVAALGHLFGHPGFLQPVAAIG